MQMKNDGVTKSLQWGHILSDVDSTHTYTQKGAEQWRFNGATSFQMWIVCVLRMRICVNSWLQWGHILSDVDRG